MHLPVGDQATLGMRQVSRRDPRSSKQAHVLTTRDDLPAGQVIYRLGSRWCQENYFRYGRLHLDLDSNDTYTATSDDPSRSVPNPDKRRAHQDVQAAHARVQRERARTDAGLCRSSWVVVERHPTLSGRMGVGEGRRGWDNRFHLTASVGVSAHARPLRRVQVHQQRQDVALACLHLVAPLVEGTCRTGQATRRPRRVAPTSVDACVLVGGRTHSRGRK